MRSLLLVADINSIHIYNYCKNFLSKEDFQVTLLNIGGGEETVNKEYLNFYKELNYKILYTCGLATGRWAFFVSFYKVLKQAGEYDILHLHYVNHYLCPAIFFLSKRFKHIVLSYWGSDLLRSNFMKRSMTLPLIIKANAISLLTKEMYDRFSTISFLYRKNLKKCSIVDFGNLFFDSIKENQERGLTPSRAKKLMGLDPDKLCIAIGYNCRREMQQIEALEGIFHGNFKYVENVQFVIPAVGIDNSIKERIESLLNANKADYYFQQNFLSESQLPIFRLACDVFIHPQTTDSLSCAMMEHLYAGGVVINGSWLKYNVLDNNMIYYYQFDEFADLPNLLNSIIESIDKIKEQSAENRQKIDSFASWSYWRNKWALLYEMK